MDLDTIAHAAASHDQSHTHPAHPHTHTSELCVLFLFVWTEITKPFRRTLLLASARVGLASAGVNFRYSFRGSLPQRLFR